MAQVHDDEGSGSSTVQVRLVKYSSPSLRPWKFNPEKELLVSDIMSQQRQREREIEHVGTVAFEDARNHRLIEPIPSFAHHPRVLDGDVGVRSCACGELHGVRAG